jgi:APA family basic amino acid/polyamine antiporter
MNLWATKSITVLRAQAEETGAHSLKRTLGPLNLTTLGIGAIIGAGIFVLTGQAAALHAGPAVPISMILVGIACAFAGLCYAEMASAVPVAGSAYTYSYATMGEFIAWIIGWDLVLEYAAGAATVGVGWSGHFVSLLGQRPRRGAPRATCRRASRGARTPGSTSPAPSSTRPRSSSWR